jgi:hypothetical protein
MLILATKLKNRFSPAHACTLKNIRVNDDKRGCSGFVTLDGVHVYVNTEACGALGYMYRTAQHLKDYTGGVNRWARDLDSLVRGVNELLQAQIIAKRSGAPVDRLIVVNVKG